MLYYNFNNYEEFKNLLESSSTGTTTRAGETRFCWLI